MEIRKATMEDFEEIQKIYAYARAFMKANGNGSQWGDHKPLKEDVIADIHNQKMHVCIEGDKILGVFYFAIERDPTYAVIYEGQWLDDDDYAVVHKVATAEGTKGVATFFMNWAYEQTRNIRIDTHKNNIPMQGLLKKLGFTYCGIIHLLDGDERIAFHKHGA